MKKILSLLLVFVVAMSLFTGCKKETPKEALKKGFENSLNLKTAKSNFDMTVNFELDEAEASNEAFLLQMINGSKISGEFTSDVEKIASSGELVLDMNGMAYKADFYSTPEKLAFKMPMINKYIVMDQTALNNDPAKQKEEMKKLNTEVMDVLLKNIKDESIKVLEKEKISTPEGDVEITGYEIAFNNDEAMKIAEELFSFIFKNETFKNSMKTNLKNQAKLEGKEELSDEEIEAKLEEAQKEMDEAIVKMKENLAFDSLVVTYGLDKNYNIVSSKANVAVTAKISETEEKTISFSFDINSKVWDINKPVTIEMPELNEENSVKFEDLANEFPLGMQ
ncbi:hypothetical protein R9X47_27715 [Wukongibacter baidiensis]|uniref:hypothetical protein n=1 Tax=Wukongibacter baidiensis TaxID=1723361 RepID=UPI003D7F52D9